MTRLKIYSYFIVDRMVLKPRIFGPEISFLKVAFCPRVLYFPCLASVVTTLFNKTSFEIRYFNQVSLQIECLKYGHDVNLKNILNQITF